MDLSDFSFFFRFSEMVVLSKVFKPDNFELHDSLNLRFINIQFFFEFCWLWIFSWIKLLWYYCSVWDKLERFDWLKQYHGEVVYVREGLAFAWDSPLENSEYSYLCFQLALFCSVFYFFSISRSMSSCLCSVLVA